MRSAEVLSLSPPSHHNPSLHCLVSSPGDTARADTERLVRRFNDAIAEAVATATASTVSSRPALPQPGVVAGASGALHRAVHLLPL